jgi:thiol-disulfide isomerase/thioredoxin
MKLIIIKGVFFLGTIIILAFAGGCAACKTDGSKKEGTKMSVDIVGQVSWDYWKKNTDWEDYSAEDYFPENPKIESLQPKLKDNSLSFLLVGGSWCGDSRTGMPQIYKLFGEAGYDIDKIRLYGVNRDKNEPTNIAKLHGIEKVPTLIVFRNEKEIGRIIETPAISWEDDLLEILK